MDLKQFIRDVPDFPQEGILFRDITPLLQSPEALRHVVDEFTERYREADLQAIVSIESRGFLFGAPLAYNLGLPLVPVRKPGKLPHARMTVEYELEYGTGTLDIHADALKNGDRVLIVDDLLATGGTAMAAARLVELLGGVVHGFAFLVELGFLAGRSQLTGYDVTALINYD
ncbi:MAG TPA: adenine phosphoribosyltransferase [Dehalococcoidia bacterium]|nr:adenine phosphoribosyltransferase [Dehalococcoidia bacterium]